MDGIGDGRRHPAQRDLGEPLHTERVEPPIIAGHEERLQLDDVGVHGHTSTREHGGLGLGLAPVRHLVELHGGTVTAASAGEGQGATFVVTLPAEGITAVSEFRPHVIVADVGTPGEEGYAFVRALRSRSAEEGGLTPAAALTARPDEARRILQSGFQMQVTKPVEPARLIAAITTLASDGRPSRPRV